MKLITILILLYVPASIGALLGGMIIANWSDVMTWSINGG